jgi:hypothetical protein
MSYITLNGKLVKVNKSFKQDPNVKDIVSLLSKHTNVKIKAVALTPTVKMDTDNHYSAVYTDSHGSYVFEIYKTSNGYTVISDGNVCSKDNPDREFIIWNYESQVAAHMPRVLA